MPGDTKEEKSTITPEELIAIAYPKALTGDFNAAITLCYQFHCTRGSKARSEILCAVFKIYEEVKPLSSTFIFHMGANLAYLYPSLQKNFDRLAMTSEFDDLIETLPPYALVTTINQLGTEARNRAISRNTTIVHKLCFEAENNSTYEGLKIYFLLKKIFDEMEVLPPALTFHYGNLLALVDPDISADFNQLAISSASIFDSLLRKQSPKQIGQTLFALDEEKRTDVVIRNKTYFKTMRNEIIKATGISSPGLPELIIGFMEKSDLFFFQPVIQIYIKPSFANFSLLENYFQMMELNFMVDRLRGTCTLRSEISDLQKEKGTHPSKNLFPELYICVTKHTTLFKTWAEETPRSKSIKTTVINVCNHLLTKLEQINPSLAPAKR